VAGDDLSGVGVDLGVPVLPIRIQAVQGVREPAPAQDGTGPSCPRRPSVKVLCGTPASTGVPGGVSPTLVG
jgi:hypothetical protein